MRHASGQQAGMLGEFTVWSPSGYGRRPRHWPYARHPCGRELSYRRLWESSGRMAARLAEHGIGPGSVVALDLDRGADLVVALLGVVRTGAAYLPLDGHAPQDRVTAVLKDARAQAVVVGRGTQRRSRSFEVDAATPLLTVFDAPDTPTSPPPTTTRRPTPLSTRRVRCASATPPAPPVFPRASSSRTAPSATWSA